MDGERSGEELRRRDAPEAGGSYDLPWADRLRHRRDPNRVSVAPPPTAPVARAPLPGGPAAAGVPTAAGGVPFAPAGSAQPPTRRDEPERSYYDVPMLKKPVWRWEIAGYFFLGGLSAGAHVLGRVAEIFGRGRYRALTRASTAVAALAAVPCAPLLIHDLGDPRRFHHMLRVWKPSSPMNVGTWTVTAFSGAVAVALLHEWARGRGRDERTALGRIAEWVRGTDRTIMAVTDAAGVPLGLLMAGYTGVLLSNTSTPLWSQNPWLGALFSASAIGTGAAATSLAMEAAGGHDPVSRRALNRIETAAHVAQGVTLTGYLKRAGPLAHPLTRGGMRKYLWGSLAALACSEILKHVPFRGRRPRRRAGMLAAVLSLASGLSLRWAVVHGGRESAADPIAARAASRPTPPSNRAVRGAPE